jgi:hypothetical protein
MIRRWKAEDPAPRPQQALPSSTIHMIAMTYGNSLSLKRWVTADLVVVAYFFLLRVGEYTPTTQKKGSAKQTIPSRSRTSPSGTTRTPSQLTHQSNDSSKQTESPLTSPTRKTEPKLPRCPTPNPGIKPVPMPVPGPPGGRAQRLSGRHPHWDVPDSNGNKPGVQPRHPGSC